MCLTYSADPNYIIGFKQLNNINSQKIDFVCKKYNAHDCIVLDTNYFARLKYFSRNDKEFKNFIQPLQVHYFVNGYLQSTLINCYASPSGIFNIDWNKEGNFNQFPPRGHAVNNHVINIKEFKELIGDKNRNVNDTLIYVFWTNSFYKKSLTLLDQVKKNKETYCPHCRLSLVNNDQEFIKH